MRMILTKRQGLGLRDISVNTDKAQKMRDITVQRRAEYRNNWPRYILFRRSVFSSEGRVRKILIALCTLESYLSSWCSPSLMTGSPLLALKGK